jgi:hypothetical protein
MMPAKPIKHREIRLIPWTDCIGRFVRLEIDELQVSVVLSCGSGDITLSFPTGSLESQTLQRELSGCKPGTRIALVATDQISQPLLVRKIAERVKVRGAHL